MAVPHHTGLSLLTFRGDTEVRRRTQQQLGWWAEAGRGRAGLSYLPGHPPRLPVGLRVFHGFADLLQQLVQFHRRFNQNRAELLPSILQPGDMEEAQFRLKKESGKICLTSPQTPRMGPHTTYKHPIPSQDSVYSSTSPKNAFCAA